jgi:hypothetical protein
MEGLRLRFHLAGINNQNFLMRDEETGTYWQQISGLAVSGPLAGRHLTLVPSDELTWALWKSEQPSGTVLNDLAPFVSQYSRKDWDVRMGRAPVVINFPEKGVAQRDIMLGLQAFGVSRAFPYDAVLKDKLIEDHVGAEPVILVLGPDDQSVRVFRRRIPGVSEVPEFYRVSPSEFMDDATGSTWNFQGCAVSGKSQGKCLERVEVIKDYWFDWRNYNPETTIYRPR